MTSIIIGISGGLLTIILLGICKQLDKKIMYGLTLAGIVFLYVGFTWTDISSLIVTSLQAIGFVLIVYVGIKKNGYYLAAGYFLHGIWDLVYDIFRLPNVIPPHYDLFCLSIDFTIGFYIAILQYRLTKQHLYSASRSASI